MKYTYPSVQHLRHFFFDNFDRGLKITEYVQNTVEKYHKWLTSDNIVSVKLCDCVMSTTIRKLFDVNVYATF